MEFRRLVIAQKDSSVKYIFNNKVNLVTSTLLSEELLKTNYELENTTYYFETLDNISIAEVFQIKVRIAETGVMMLNFKKDGLSEEDKQKLLEEISALKDNQEPTEDAQKAKIGRVFDIIIKYNPIYVSYVNTGDFLFTRSTFEIIVMDKEIDFPILVLLAPFGYEDKPTKQKGLFSSKPKPAAQPKTNEQPVEKKETSTTTKKDIINQLKSVDYIFFGIFSIFIAFGVLISAYEIANGNGIAVLLFILSVIYVVILNYTTYKAFKENEYLKYRLDRLIIPILYMIVGLVIGFVIGYLITTFVIKPKEDVVINYGLMYGISIPLSMLLSFTALIIPIPVSKIIAFIKKKK